MLKFIINICLLSYLSLFIAGRCVRHASDERLESENQLRNNAKSSRGRYGIFIGQSSARLSDL